MLIRRKIVFWTFWPDAGGLQFFFDFVKPSKSTSNNKLKTFNSLRVWKNWKNSFFLKLFLTFHQKRIILSAIWRQNRGWQNFSKFPLTPYSRTRWAWRRLVSLPPTTQTCRPLLAGSLRRLRLINQRIRRSMMTRTHRRGRLGPIRPIRYSIGKR